MYNFSLDGYNHQHLEDDVAVISLRIVVKEDGKLNKNLTFLTMSTMFLKCHTQQAAL